MSPSFSSLRVLRAPLEKPSRTIMGLLQKAISHCVKIPRKVASEASNVYFQNCVAPIFTPFCWVGKLRSSLCFFAKWDFFVRFSITVFIWRQIRAKSQGLVLLRTKKYLNRHVTDEQRRKKKFVMWWKESQLKLSIQGYLQTILSQHPSLVVFWETISAALQSWKSWTWIYMAEVRVSRSNNFFVSASGNA